MTEALKPPDLDAEIRPAETEALALFEPASAELVAQRRLQKRTDAKFVASRSIVPDLLEQLVDDFHVMMSDGAPWATYDTLYYDSQDFGLFHLHRRGQRPRHKVRVRHYAERDLCFLETKTKDRYDVTTKHRFERDATDFELRSEDVARIEGAVGSVASLHPAVWLRFPRVGLVGVGHHERLTIDLGLAISYGGFQASFHDSCIIELKQARFDARSPGAMALRKLGLRPRSMSKYCVGLSVLGRVDRTNVFHPAIRELERANG